MSTHVKNPEPQERRVSPLENVDPPKIGDFWLDARLLHLPSGLAYAAHADDLTPVILILLSAGASADGAARDRLAGLVNRMHIDTVVARGGHGQDEGRLAHKFRTEEDDPVTPDHDELAPWVALADDGSDAAFAEAARVLQEIGLATTPPKGEPKGPDYALPWEGKDEPGHSRMWPLPWPGRYDRAGLTTLITSMLLMILLALMALLTIILLFQKAPEMPPPPPVPTSMIETPPPSDSSASPTPASPSSASPSSGSPSPSSASPSEGSPSPNSKL